MDEFKGRKTIQFINSFSEGRSMSLARKYLPPIIKERNMPFIICSNFNIRTVYHNCDSIVIDALEGRFTEIEIPLGECLDINFEWDDSDSDTVEAWSSGDEESPSDNYPELVPEEEGPIEGPINNTQLKKSKGIKDFFQYRKQ